MFQISTIENFETDVHESSGNKRDVISSCSSTPKLVQTHDSPVSVMIF